MGKTFRNSVKAKANYIVPDGKINRENLTCQCGAGVMKNEWHKMRGNKVIACPACAYDN